MFVVGLTGGIGSGKTAAAAEFARLGAVVIDADAIARELTEAGGAAMPFVAKLFGQDYVRLGAMDRKAMRERVFSDASARRALEGLLHPLIRDESARRIAAADETKAGPYVVHVVPLLVESPGYRERVDRVLVVDTPERAQIERVQARSSLGEEQVRAIMATQLTREKRLAAADDVIDNSSTLDALQKQVRALHAKYLAMAKR